MRASSKGNPTSPGGDRADLEKGARVFRRMQSEPNLARPMRSRQGSKQHLGVEPEAAWLEVERTSWKVHLQQHQEQQQQQQTQQQRQQPKQQRPASPLTAFTRGEVAIVRKVELRDAAPMAGADDGLSMEMSPGLSMGPSLSMGRRPSKASGVADSVDADFDVGRSGSKLSATSGGGRRAASKEYIRPLTEDEVMQKMIRSAALFQESEVVNLQARSAEDTAALISLAREQRKKSKDMPASRKGSKESVGALQGAGSRKPSKESAATEPLVSQMPSNTTSTTAGQPAEESSPKKMSFMEKMGYGVKPKTPPGLAKAGESAVMSPEKSKWDIVRKAKSQGFVDLGPPAKNDLKERLARRKLGLE